MSLAVFKPAQVIDFGWEATDREWDPGKLDAVRGITAQPDLFDDQSWRRTFQIVDKVPYNFHYRIEDADGRTSRMADPGVAARRTLSKLPAPDRR